MSAGVKNCLKDYCKTFQFFSIAFDESINAKDTAQLAVFARGVNSAFDAGEEFVQLVPIKGTTTGADILEALLMCTTDMELGQSVMICVTTNGAPAMVEKKERSCGSASKTLGRPRNKLQNKRMHCIIHQGALCAKPSNLKDVMDI